ncbi:MAG: polysaccharide deacetylase family protein [Bryobacterales bacterium]|nr:polysaccharide deacetylase family protein [Bryobacterales bacterium]
MAWAVRGRSSAVFAPSVWRGVRDRRAIALTFDDGPSESTSALLDLLDEARAPATFFLCGVNVRRLPEVAREIARRGHELGNHSDTHDRFYLRTPGFIRHQIVEAQATIAGVTGVRPALLRVPYGARWFGLRQVQSELGLLGVMWTALGRDWKLPAEAVFHRLARAARNGAIFCLHDGRERCADPDITSTLEAVRRLIPALRGQGYHFETVSRILSPTA